MVVFFVLSVLQVPSPGLWPSSYFPCGVLGEVKTL